MAINMATKTIDEKPITGWTVWFRTLTGLHQTMDDALIAAAAEELPPHMIKAVPIALAEGWYEERLI